MESSNNLYRAIGKLFYAIASVDNTVHFLEYKTVVRLIGQEGSSSNESKHVIIPHGSKEILKSFYTMLQAGIPAYDAFKGFVSYKKTHEQEFTPEIKKWIWQIADSITYSFARKNKSEVIILSKLKETLQK